MGVILKPSGKAIETSMNKQFLASAFIIGATNPEKDFRLKKNETLFISMIEELTETIITKNHNPEEERSVALYEAKMKLLTEKTLKKSLPKLLGAAKDGLTFTVERQKRIDKVNNPFLFNAAVGGTGVATGIVTTIITSLLQNTTPTSITLSILMGAGGTVYALAKPMKEIFYKSQNQMKKLRTGSHHIAATTIRSLVRSKALTNSTISNNKEYEKSLVVKGAEIYKNLKQDDREYLRKTYTENEKSQANLSM